PDEDTSLEFDASSVGPFSFGFTYFSKSDLHVSIDGVELGQGDFTHTPSTAKDGGYDGGSITLNVAVSGGAGVLWRVIDTVRVSTYSAGPISPQTISRDMTRMVGMAQDARRDIDRNLLVGVGRQVDLGAPPSSGVAYLVRNALGNIIQSTGVISDVAPEA